MSGTAHSGPVCPRIALLFAHCLAARRCRPPTLLAMGQNRRKTGKTCPWTPSARSGRMGLQWMRAKSNSPSPASVRYSRARKKQIPISSPCGLFRSRSRIAGHSHESPYRDYQVSRAISRCDLPVPNILARRQTLILGFGQQALNRGITRAASRSVTAASCRSTRWRAVRPLHPQATEQHRRNTLRSVKPRRFLDTGLAPRAPTCQNLICEYIILWSG